MHTVVLWQSPNEKWLINKVIYPRTNRIRVEITDGWFCEYPIYYEHNGGIAYDYPERLPKYVKEKAERIIRNMVQAGTWGEYIESEEFANA